MASLRFLVCETDADERKRLIEALESGGISVVDAFDPALGHNEIGEAISVENVVDKLLWLKPEKFSGIIIGGPEGDREDWYRVMSRQGYRLRESMRVYSHCSGDSSGFVKDRLTHGNLGRNLGKDEYLVNLAHLLQEAKGKNARGI